MKLSKESLVAAARTSTEMEEVAEKVGYLKDVPESKFSDAMEHFAQTIAKICPGLESIWQRREAELDMRRCSAMEDLAGHAEAKSRMMDLTIKVIDLGYGLDFAMAAPKRALPTESKVRSVLPRARIKAVIPAKKVEFSESSPKVTSESSPVVSSTTESIVEILTARRADLEDAQLTRLRSLLLAAGPVDSEPIRMDILGIIPAGAGVPHEYRGRPIVVLVLRPQVFGREVVLARSVRRVTLHGGILNHCEMDEHPSPYWAILDAMSDLKKFNKAGAIKQAVKLHGAGRNKSKYPTLASYAAAGNWAYDVLKTHQVHPRKCHAGMTHMVQDCGSADKGMSEIRGRRAHETFEYFEEHRAKLAKLRSGGDVPLASLGQ